MILLYLAIDPFLIKSPIESIDYRKIIHDHNVTYQKMIKKI